LQSERTAGQELRYRPAPQLDDPWVTLQGVRAGSCGVDAIRDFTAHMPGAAVVALPDGPLESGAGGCPRSSPLSTSWRNAQRGTWHRARRSRSANCP